jgi:hypothetical protein
VVSAAPAILLLAAAAPAAPPPSTAAAEAAYYRVETYDPAGIELEVTGMDTLSDGRIMMATRGGEVFVLENPADVAGKGRFSRWAFGLSTPGGLVEHKGSIWVAQRGELTRIRDTDRDGLADLFETVSDGWEVGGNYHEYAFGPAIDRRGHMWITLNKPFGPQPYGRAHWRGWAFRVDPRTGKATPEAAGLRSPAGVEVSPWGDVFYTDNQGEWCNAGKLSHVRRGDFHGHPWGLPSVELPESPLKRPKEKEVPDGEYMKDLPAKIPNFRLPAIWFPYDKMGKSVSGLRWDLTGGKFGPFRGQIFVGDQHHASVMRVFLEKVNGHWQGAAFRFREGLRSGVVRVSFARDGALFVGMTNTGWGGKGTHAFGLQKIVWTGKAPFEIHEMRARRDGFELVFTKPVDRAALASLATYTMTSYTYRLRSAYGGPEEDVKALAISRAEVDRSGRRVRLAGARAEDGSPLVHPEAYYTLIERPR